jgi:hypothetical protein
MTPLEKEIYENSGDRILEIANKTLTSEIKNEKAKRLHALGFLAQTLEIQSVHEEIEKAKKQLVTLNYFKNKYSNYDYIDRKKLESIVGSNCIINSSLYKEEISDEILEKLEQVKIDKKDIPWLGGFDHWTSTDMGGSWPKVDLFRVICNTDDLIFLTPVCHDDICGYLIIYPKLTESFYKPFKKNKSSNEKEWEEFRINPNAFKNNRPKDSSDLDNLPKKKHSKILKWLVKE